MSENRLAENSEFARSEWLKNILLNEIRKGTYKPGERIPSVRALCEKYDVPVQTYANRSDIAGGSTLGNLAMAQVSMPAADIGLPQFAMHSAYETAGVKDMEYLIRLAKNFFA